MTFLNSEIPPDISPGYHHVPRFQGFLMSQWRKAELGQLLSVIQQTPEGTDGLEKVKEIAARRARETMDTYMSTRNQLPLEERIAGVRACVVNILLCRPFLPPSIFSKVKDFVDKTTSILDEEGVLRNILDEQKRYQELISTYGDVVSLRKSVNFKKAIQDFLFILRELPTKECPRGLIELLENNTTAEATWRHIGFTYVALNREKSAHAARDTAKKRVA